MDFHGMKRTDLQTLCKKHGIPANLKNIEMATRLAHLFKETVTEIKFLLEDSVETDGIKDDLVVSKEARRVRFSPENEVFEFTRSGRNCQRKTVRMRSKGVVQDLQQGGIELRQSKPSVVKGITVAGSAKNKSNTSRGGFSDVTKALEVPRRSKRIGSSVTTQEDCKVTESKQFEFEDISDGLKIGRRSTRLKANLLESCVGGGTLKAKTLLPAKRSKRLVDIDNKKNELVKINVKDLSMDVQDDPNEVDKVPWRFVNGIDVQTNTQNRRRSIRLKAKAANSSVGGEKCDDRLLCSAKESKNEIKTKQSERSRVVKIQEGKEMKVQDVSTVEKVPRRSKRLRKDNIVLMNKRPVKAVKREKSLNELLLDGQAQKGDKQSKRTLGNDREDKKLPPSLKHTALDKMTNSLKSCSIIDCEQDGASVGNVKKSNVNIDEIQVPVRFKSSRHDLFDEAPIVVEMNRVENKTDETLETKRDRSAEPEMDIETTLTQSNLLDQYAAQFEREEAEGTNVESGGSSKNPKTMSQEYVKNKPQGMIENSPSSSETEAAKTVDISQRANTQVLSSELMQGKHEEKLERDIVLMAAIEDDRDELSSSSVLLIDCLSPASVQLAVSNPEAELVVPSSHNLVKDIAEENTKTMEKTVICTPKSELKEHSSAPKLAKVEAVLKNSAECWKEIHQSKDDEKGFLEKEVQGANLHGNFFEYNTENNGAEEEMEITKASYVSVGHCVNIIPEKLLDDSTQLASEEAGDANVEARGSSKEMNTVNQECVKDKPQEMAEEDSPSTVETKATEPVMISENVLDLTLKSSDDISPRGNSQELDSDLMEGDREEKHEQDRVLVAAIKENEEASSLSVFLIERSEVSNPEVELFVETTPPPASEQLEVSNHKVELDVPTAQILVKDIASTVIANDDIKTKEKIQSVAKLEDAEAILENSAECWNEIHSRKDDEKGSLEKIIQGENLHGNFSEYITENSKVGCITVGHSGKLESLDEVKDDSLEKTEQTISCESGFKLNELELRRWFPTKEDNTVSKCFKEDEIKALSQPLPRNKDVTVFDQSAICEEDKAVELHVDCGIFTSANKNVLLERDEEMKGDDMTTNSHVAPESQSHMGGFEPDVDMNVDLLGESNTSTILESHLLFVDSGIDETKATKDHTAAPCEESFVFTSRERQQILINSQPHNHGKEERNKVEFKDESALFSKLESSLVLEESGQARLDIGKSYLSQYLNHHSSAPKFYLKDDSIVRESHVAAQGFRDNIIADSSGSMASKVSYNLEFNVEQETAGAKIMKNGSQAVDVESLDATQEKSKKNSEHSLHVDSVNLFDIDIEEAETIMEAERKVSCSSDVIAGACPMVSEESGFSTDVQNQIHDALEELTITDGTEDELLGFVSEVDFGKTCENPKFLEDEAADLTATAFGKPISLTSVQKNMNEKAADEEIIRRETASSIEKTLHESSDNKEYLNIDESGTSSEKQVRREPILVYRTQVKPTRHDMKENAPNSKLVDHLNVTALRTSKRRPLLDLRKN